MNRRGFLKSILATGVAPYVVTTAGVLMPVKQIVTAREIPIGFVQVDDELFLVYGGARGGGKSELLAMNVLRGVQQALGGNPIRDKVTLTIPKNTVKNLDDSYWYGDRIVTVEKAHENPCMYGLPELELYAELELLAPHQASRGGIEWSIKG